MPVHVETFGFRELAAELGHKAATIDGEAGRITVRTASQVADAMRANVPKRTGETARSTSVNIEGTEAEVTIGGAAVFLEFGTSRMAPRPFIGMSVDPQLDPYEQALADAADF